MAVYGFGQVTVPAAGTPVNLGVALGFGPTSGKPMSIGILQKVIIQARPANAGIVYIFSGSDGTDHRTDRELCMAILAHPTSATDGPFDRYEIDVANAAGGLNLANLWIDAASNGDGVIISGSVN